MSPPGSSSTPLVSGFVKLPLTSSLPLGCLFYCRVCPFLAAHPVITQTACALDNLARGDTDLASALLSPWLPRLSVSLLFGPITVIQLRHQALCSHMGLEFVVYQIGF